MDGKQWRALREARLMTQAHLAEAAGVGIKTIVRLEGGSRVSFESLRAVRAVLGVGDEDTSPCAPAIPASSQNSQPNLGHPANSDNLDGSDKPCCLVTISGSHSQETSQETSVKAINHWPAAIAKVVGSTLAGIVLAVLCIPYLPGFSFDATRYMQVEISHTADLRNAMRQSSIHMAALQWRHAVLGADAMLANGHPPDVSGQEVWNGTIVQVVPLVGVAGWANQKDLDYVQHTLLRGGTGMTASDGEGEESTNPASSPIVSSIPERAGGLKYALENSRTITGFIKEWSQSFYSMKMYSGADTSHGNQGYAWVKVIMSPLSSDACNFLKQEMSAALPGRLVVSAIPVHSGIQASEVAEARGDGRELAAECSKGWNALQAVVTSKIPAKAETELEKGNP